MDEVLILMEEHSIAIAGDYTGAYNFRLYLTTTAVHFYEQANLFWRLCTCTVTNHCYQIPLTDIQNSAVGYMVGVKKGQGCCSVAETINSMRIFIELKPGKSPIWCWRCCNIPTVFTIVGCKNSTEFVDAVKKQMALTSGSRMIKPDKKDINLLHTYRCIH